VATGFSPQTIVITFFPIMWVSGRVSSSFGRNQNVYAGVLVFVIIHALCCGATLFFV